MYTRPNRENREPQVHIKWIQKVGELGIMSDIDEWLKMIFLLLFKLLIILFHMKIPSRISCELKDIDSGVVFRNFWSPLYHPELHAVLTLH